jgi:thioesterase domain-containing protein
MMLETVQRAWTEVLPDAPFEPDLPWHETGADSLQTLQLLLRLERALGRKVPFDTVDADTTPLLLAQRLDAGSGPEAAEGSRTVFVLPGAFGDQPLFAQFRRSLAHEVDWRYLDLPRHFAPAAGARVVADEIVAQQPDGAVIVTGYSLGATIGFEVCRCLLERGRRVALFMNFDGYVVPRRPLLATRGFLPGSALHRRLLKKAVWLVLRSRLGERVALGAVALFAKDGPVSRTERPLVQLRRAYLEMWRPEPLDVPVLLVISDLFAPQTLETWRGLSPDTMVLRMPGVHTDLFTPSNWAPMQDAVRAALRRAGA